MLVQIHLTVDDAVVTDDALVRWSSGEGSVELVRAGVVCRAWGEA